MPSVLRSAPWSGSFRLTLLPDAAAVNESVKLAKENGLAGLSGLVNGVLRKIGREKEQICSALADEAPWDGWLPDIALRLSDAFSEEQKEAFKDPYGNWHLMKTNDSTYCLFEQLTSRQYTCEPSIYHCDTCSSWGSMHGVWNWNSPYNSPLSIVVKVEGAGSISDLCLIHQWGRLEIPCTVEAGQYLIYDGKALITDLNYNTIEEVKPSGKVRLMEGENPVSFTCSIVGKGKKMPEVTVRYLICSSPQMVILPQKKPY